MRRAVQIAAALTLAWSFYLMSHLKGLNWMNVWVEQKHAVLIYLGSFFVSALGAGTMISSFLPSPTARNLGALKRKFESGKMEVRREQ